jgi:hypothetical protein
MPRIPVYESQQVESRALPGVHQSSVASPSLLGAAAEQQIATGKGLSNAGTGIANAAAAAQDRENADKLFQAEAAFKEQFIPFDTEQRSKRGAAALAEGGITRQAQDWFRKTSEQVGKGLDNDVQRQLFNHSVEKLRLHTLDTFSKHQATEARASLADSTKATIKGAIDLAAASPSDWTVMEAQRTEIDKRLAVLAQLNGYAGDTPEEKAIRDGMRGEMLTQMHKQVLQGLVKQNPSGAVAYFEKYSGDIDGAQRVELGDFARKATATSVGDGTADEIWQAMRPKSRTDPVTLDEMETRLRGTLKGNDDATKVGIAGLRERAGAYRDQRKEEATSLEASVNGLILRGMSTRDILKSPEYLKLSAQAPEDARKIDTFLDNKDYMRGVRADAAEARTQRRLHRDTLDTMLRLSNPDVLVGMTRNEVVNLLPVLGGESAQALLQRWDLLTKSENKLKEARIDKQDFDTTALRAGFRPNEKHKSEEEKDALVRLQSTVENSIDVEQRSKKRDLTREEKRTIMQREIDNEVLTKRFLRSDQKKPVGVLTPDEQKTAYVTVGPKDQKVTLAEIPAAYRANAIRQRAGAGLTTSEKQLAELWLRSQNKFVEK